MTLKTNNNLINWWLQSEQEVSSNLQTDSHRGLSRSETQRRLQKFGHNQLLEHRAGELLAEDLRLAHQSLCEITGEFTPDDLLGEIFSSFCIGK